MKRWISCFLCVLLVLAAVAAPASAEAVPESVMDSLPSVVRIEVTQPDVISSGSGFVVKSDRTETLIVTNYHVADGEAYSISVWLGAEETVSAEILAFSDQKDLCILKLSYPVALTALPLAASDSSQGEAVYAVGYPAAADILSDREAHAGADATITDGIVSAVRETTVAEHGTPVGILQISAAINPGNSGGPLFNGSGEVTGINTYGIVEAQGIFGAISASELKSFLADHGIAAEVRKAQKTAPGVFVWIIAIAAVAVMGLLLFLLRKRRGVLLVAVLVCIAAAALLLTGMYALRYNRAVQLAEREEFTEAEETLWLPEVTALHDMELAAYLHAGQLMEQRQFEAAKDAFSALHGYRDAARLADEADYRRAAQLADRNEFDAALEVYAALAEKGYADSEEKIPAVRFRQGLYLLHTEQAYSEAESIFCALEKAGFPKAIDMIRAVRYSEACKLLEDGLYLEACQSLKEIADDPLASEMLVELTQEIYHEGIRLYRLGDYETAEQYFRTVSDYSESEHYLSLITAHIFGLGYLERDTLVAELRKMLELEDANKVIMKYQHLAVTFLNGKWISSDKKRVFIVNDDESFTYVNMPVTLDGVFRNNEFIIENGNLFLYTPVGKDVRFSFEIINENCMDVFCHADGNTYRMYRTDS